MSDITLAIEGKMLNKVSSIILIFLADLITLRTLRILKALITVAALEKSAILIKVNKRPRSVAMIIKKSKLFQE